MEHFFYPKEGYSVKIKELHLFPIKGFRSVSVPSFHLEEKGPRYDRRWMLIDENNKFISQRNKPELTQFKIQLSEDGIQVHGKHDSIEVPITIDTGEDINVSLWRSKIKCIEHTPSYHEWFSDQLNMKCKLVHMRAQDSRKRVMQKIEGKNDVSFADGYPYLFLGTASCDFLNEKLSNPVSSDRFRANIILETSIPHEEDELDSVTLGECKFQVIKPCARCTVITLDQSTGKQNPETLQVLKTYRQQMNKVNFGANAVALDYGIISVGDKVITS